MLMVRIIQISCGCFQLAQYTQADPGTCLVFSLLEDSTIRLFQDVSRSVVCPIGDRSKWRHILEWSEF